ncbi:hypothetical protein BDB01DRAFT_848354 [Pilobolus umbonatus]|nr:hypothetical protein BDB01DRAFT_848354 [Pilobolus umbonatus]
MLTQNGKKIRIAVIGTGLAGLSTAYMLTEGEIGDDKQIEVFLFEKNESVGMDAASISIGTTNEYRVDVPMRSFMSGYYSHLFNLYQHLKIPIKKAEFSFGWYTIMKANDAPDICSHTEIASHTENKSYLLYSGSKTIGSLEMVRGSRFKNLFDILEDIGRFLCTSIIVAFSYLWVLIISLWMHHRGHLDNPQHPICNLTLGTFFKEYHIPSYFAHKVFVPLFASVCTNSHKSMLEYPASDILQYMAVGFSQESYVAACGVQQVVQKLCSPLQNIHLKTQITSIRPNIGNPQYRFQMVDEQGKMYDMDHIIFATQGNQALLMLKEYHKNIEKYKEDDIYEKWKSKKSMLSAVDVQMDMLRSFPYESALVINHTDSRLLPSNSNNWKTLNFANVDKSVTCTDSDIMIPYSHDTTMATHILNMTHRGLEDDIYMQTTNPCIPIDQKKILSVSWFERATLTLQSKNALQKYLFIQEGNKIDIGPCQGSNGMWFVGSYCWKGIPLLEGCVASAEYVVLEGIAKAENINMSLPWL